MDCDTRIDERVPQLVGESLLSGTAHLHAEIEHPVHHDHRSAGQ